MADPVLSLQIDTPSAAASLGYFIVGTSLLNGADLLAPEIIYAEKVTKARTVSIKRGMGQFQAPIFRCEAGTLGATFDNRTRLFDPSTSSDIVPGRAVRCKATYNAITYNLITGVVHDWNLAYQGGSTGDATTVIAANDGFAQLANLNVPENRPQESTGARIGALLNVIGWPSSLRSIDPGGTIMPAAGQTISALAGIQEAADSEMGEFYIDTDGTAVFRDRAAIASEARSTVSQATFGDSGGELKFSDVKVTFSDTQILNSVTLVYNQAGDSVTASDATSINLYGLWSYELQIRTTEPDTAASYATFLVSLFAQPTVTIASFTVKPFRDPVNLFPQVLGRQLGDKITVAFQPPGGGARISHNCFIRGISHDFTAALDAHDWTTTFVVQDAFAWPSRFIVGTSLLGGSDLLGW